MFDGTIRAREEKRREKRDERKAKSAAREGREKMGEAEEAREVRDSDVAAAVIEFGLSDADTDRQTVEAVGSTR